MCSALVKRCAGNIQPYPAQYGMAEGLHIGHGIGQRVLRLACGPGGLGGAGHGLPGFAQRVGMAFEFCNAGRFAYRGLYAPRQQRQPPSISTLRPSKSMA